MSGVLVTAHRPTNVDDPVRLARLVGVVRALADRVGPVTFPVHPRTAARLEAAGLTGQLDHPGVTVSGPVDYDTLLATLGRSRLAVTDSGGIQEEAAWLGVPGDRAALLDAALGRRGGGDDDARRPGRRRRRRRGAHRGGRAHRAPPARPAPRARRAPTATASTGARVAAVLADPATDRLLALTEPDFTDGRLPW